MSSQSAAQRTASRGTVNAYADAQSTRARTAKPKGIQRTAKPSMLARASVGLAATYLLLHAGPVLVCRVLLWVHGI